MIFMVLVVEVVTMEEVDLLSKIKCLVLVEVIFLDYVRYHVLYNENIYIS